MKDFGYDVSNYVDVEPIFGDLATFDRLLNEVHARGLKLILDYVPNHTSDQHPWFIESRSSRDNPKRDWYIWASARPDGSPPTNWLSYFGGSTWEWDETTQQYYLHLFVKEQPDLNWRNPAVRNAMYDVLRFWMERGVDGFRMDVISLLMKDERLRDNPSEKTGPAIHPYDIQERIYSEHRPDVHPIMREIRQVIDEYNERVAIGEIYIDNRRHWAKFYGKNNDELHMPFNFDLLFQPWSAHAMRQSVDLLEGSIPAGAWPNYVLGNHDQKRIATRFGDHAVRVAAMMLLTLRGTPTIYMGEELGMPDGHVPVDRLVDPPALNMGPEFGRDGCRTPFQWSDDVYAGFSTVEPWLPIGETASVINIEAENADPTSVLNLYRQLLRLRRATPALNHGSYEGVDHVPQSCFVYVREWENQRCVVALNFSAKPQTLGIEFLAPHAEILLSTGLDRQGRVDLTELSLRPNEGVILAI
jgi:alpha-glucosidase